MLFTWDITVPANTTANTPVTQDLKLTYGIVSSIKIKFPQGCHGLVSTRILRSESPLVPLNKDTWVTGDGEEVESQEYYELTKRPYTLKFMGKSPSTAYDHTITVRINILPPAVATLMPILDVLTRIYEKLFGRLP